MPQNLIRSLTLLHILLVRGLILCCEKAIGIFGQPLCEFRHFVTEFRDGLVVHVRLGDKFGEGYWLRTVLVRSIFAEWREQDGMDIPKRRARCSAP